MTVELICGDALQAISKMPEQSIHCCVTSPPYFGLRDYGVSGQIGLEKSPQEYVGKLVAVFREVRRVLRDDGTLWLVIGDSYANDSKWGGTTGEKHAAGLHGSPAGRGRRRTGLKGKDLVGIPWLVAFALRADGWYLRQDIIWAKPNPMPESVTDRCTKSHEYLFMLSKSPRYFFDAVAIRTPAKDHADDLRRIYGRQHDGNKSIPDEKRNGLRVRTDKQRGHSRKHTGFNDRWDSMPKTEQCAQGANKRDVWTIGTRLFSGAHFAVMPEALVEPCIKAGCSPDGTVLDPFCGSGTTGAVSAKLGRSFVGIDLNSAYVEMARARIAEAQGPLFATARA